MRALAVFLILSGTAFAQVLRPIDQHKTVDTKAVETTTIKLETLSQSTRVQPVSPLTGRLREAGKTIETKNIDTVTLQESTLPTRALPQQNFAPKRAVAPRELPAADEVKTSPAKIEKRVIHPNTPAGAEELKRQLNEPH